jgi:hypothetical protein
MYLFPSSGEGIETPTLLGPLQRANLNNWNIVLFCRPVIEISAL